MFIEECIPNDAMIIHNILNNKGFETYFVGGALRDLAINEIHGSSLKIKDWDLTTVARYEDMLKIFNKLLRVKERGKFVNKRGRVELLIPRLETTGISIGRKMFEITPMNRILNNENVFTNVLSEDLSKRDFTMNAMAYNIKSGLISSFKNNNGEMINSMEDINNKLIRSTDEPKLAFSRNYYNMFRAVLFANRFGFDIEGETLDAIRELAEHVCDINKGKLSVGFETLIMCDNFDNIFYLMDSGIMNNVCSDWDDYLMSEMIELFQKMPIEEKDYFNRLKFLYENFSDAEKIVEFFRIFGVNKNILLRFENDIRK